MRTVYALVDLRGEIIYVGSTSRPMARRGAHRRKLGEVELLPLAQLPTEEACQEEKRLIAAWRPKLNVYVSSGTSRLGMKNSKAHNESISKSMSLRPKAARVQAGVKSWELRSRAPEDTPFFGRKHSEETCETLRAHARRQFSDPERASKHREACLQAVARRREAGLPLGRANKG